MSTETLYDDLVGNSTNVNLSIVNVVATADVNQSVDLLRLNETSFGLYDARIYRSGYVKDRDMMGKVIVFNSGKLISVGTKSLRQAFAELKHAVKLLASAGFIQEVSLEPRVRNIVAYADLEHPVDLYTLLHSLNSAIYEPEQFPAVIYRPRCFQGIVVLIFASGKIVIVGSRTLRGVKSAYTHVRQVIPSF